MCKLGFAAIVIVSLIATADRSWGGGDDEKKAAQAILEKAIKSHGGEENLGKIKALYLKGTGTVHSGGDLKFNGEWYLMGSTHSKVTVDVDINGTNFRLVKVLNGDKGWQKLGDEATTALSPDELDEDKATIYGQHLTTLVPLKDKGVTLTPLGEVKAGDQTLVGLRVSRDKQSDVSLYFDKKTDLLAKLEMPVKAGGMEIVQEINFSDYKAIDGVQYPHKVEIKREGKAFVEAEFTEIRLHQQKFDDSIFAMP